ncbi:MAG: hypothetical protein KIT61_00320 [Pyrinomonadaceae bacterium]|jgi:hypothetical protein|nr:hypothetical protein [Blastocatellia bacterium]MCW5954996.1 hypothetical protein [Pyrinomonadaceae bacterium]
MGFTRGELVVGVPLTEGRLEFIITGLLSYGISQEGAKQFVEMKPVTEMNDRRILLDLVNRVFVDGSGRLPRILGKGR